MTFLFIYIDMRKIINMHEQSYLLPLNFLPIFSCNYCSINSVKHEYLFSNESNVETLDELCYTIIQVVCWVELPEQMRFCPISCKNMDPDKCDTTVWYRITRNPQEFRGFMGCQRDPRIWGVTILLIIYRRYIMCRSVPT